VLLLLLLSGAVHPCLLGDIVGGLGSIGYAGSGSGSKEEFMKRVEVLTLASAFQGAIPRDIARLMTGN